VKFWSINHGPIVQDAREQVLFQGKKQTAQSVAGRRKLGYPQAPICRVLNAILKELIVLTFCGGRNGDERAADHKAYEVW